MEKHQLGNSDLVVGPLIFGGNVFGWTVDEQSSFGLLDAFMEEGFNTIDTADAYSRWAPGNSGGESETIIGKWMHEKKNRDKVIVCTKAGADMGKGKRDISKAYILSAAEDSLRRLQTDYIDLYQTHWDDDITPVDETLEAYEILVKSGKVRWIGASNLSAARLADSLRTSNEHGYPKYQSLQPLYNLYDRDFETSLRDLCTRNHLGVITYFSLASGFLTAKYRSEADLTKSKRGEFMKKYFTPRGFRILDAIETVAGRYQVAPAMVALAWVITQPAITAPIASATSIVQLDELVSATRLVLDQDSIDMLTKAGD